MHLNPQDGVQLSEANLEQFQEDLKAETARLSSQTYPLLAN